VREPRSCPPPPHLLTLLVLLLVIAAALTGPAAVAAPAPVVTAAAPAGTAPAAAASPAPRAGVFVAPPDPAAEGARSAAAAAAPRIAERFGVAPLAELGPAAVEAPDLLAELHAWNAAHRLPLRNGFGRRLPAPRRVDLAIPPAAGAAPAATTPAALPPAVIARDGGVLAQTTFSTYAWGGRVHVAGASRLRLHLSQVTLPAEARLWVHGAGQTAGPFGREMLAPAGDLWTPSVAGDDLALDVEAPAAALAGAAGAASAAEAGFTIDAVLEIVPSRGDAAEVAAAAKDTGCQLDASCFSSADFPGYDTARHAIARLEFVEDFLAFVCTGQLLNDTASDGIPYLLTAHHCISTQAVASTLQATFDDYTPSCNGTPPDLGGLPATNGSTLLVTGRADTAADFTLLRLPSLPGGRAFLGWDPSAHAAPDGTLLYRLSHPGGNSQMYSVTVVNSQPTDCTDNFPLSRFIYSHLVTGAASPGSSGSAALLADGLVVGQLFAGCGLGDFCSPEEVPFDGALASSFKQLQPFLAPGASGACVPGDLALCLVQKRFQVQVTWTNQFDGSVGVAHAAVGTDEAGYFYFTDPSNYELVVKILGFGDVFKVFYAELTDLHFTITVADTHTGRIKSYTNTAGDCGGIDQTGFPAAAGEPGEAAATVTGAASLAPAAIGEARSSCGGGLCLLGGRFTVGVTWMNQFTGASGSGRPHALSDASGLFTFSSPADIELVVKAVQFSNRIAFFYAALSDFEYDIAVTDTTTGGVRTYHNPAGNYCGGIDNDAFPP
jgi:hypothetical protein